MLKDGRVEFLRPEAVCHTSAMTWSRGKIAGLLFMVGGALSLIASIAGAVGSAPGAWLGLVGLLLEGVAFVLFGLGFARARTRAWVPWLFVIAGALMIVMALLWMVGGGLGAATRLVQLAIVALIVVAAVLLLSARSIDSILAIALIVLGALLAITLFVGNVVIGVLIGAAYILVGLLVWGVRFGRSGSGARRG